MGGDVHPTVFFVSRWTVKILTCLSTTLSSLRLLNLRGAWPVCSLNQGHGELSFAVPLVERRLADFASDEIPVAPGNGL